MDATALFSSACGIVFAVQQLVALHHPQRDFEGFAEATIGSQSVRKIAQCPVRELVVSRWLSQRRLCSPGLSSAA